MSKKSDQFIAIPENLDYRATDFYDMDEDERDVQSIQLYEDFSDLNKRYIELKEIASGGMKIISRAYEDHYSRNWLGCRNETNTGGVLWLIQTIASTSDFQQWMRTSLKPFKPVK